MDNVIPAPPVTTLPVEGDERLFPVRRVFCVGRNYAAHAREMGHDPDRDPPFFFTKPADALVPGGGTIPYPAATNDLRRRQLVNGTWLPEENLAGSVQARPECLATPGGQRIDCFVQGFGPEQNNKLQHLVFD